MRPTCMAPPPQAHREPPPGIGFLYEGSCTLLQAETLWAQALRHKGSGRPAALVPSALYEQPWVSMSQAILRETRAPPLSQPNALRIA